MTNFGGRPGRIGAAVRAGEQGRVQVVEDLLARQARRQGLAAVRALPGRRRRGRRCRFRRIGRGRGRLRFQLRQDLAGEEQQLGGVEPLGHAAEAVAQELLELVLELGDQVLLGVHARDLTGGFKCFRRTALEAIDLDAVSARGYGFQIETTYRVLRAGLRVREVPIRFVDRRVGDSKMTGSIVAEAIWRVPLLRLRALTGRL